MVTLISHLHRLCYSQKIECDLLEVVKWRPMGPLWERKAAWKKYWEEVLTSTISTSMQCHTSRDKPSSDQGFLTARIGSYPCPSKLILHPRLRLTSTHATYKCIIPAETVFTLHRFTSGEATGIQVKNLSDWKFHHVFPPWIRDAETTEWLEKYRSDRYWINRDLGD